MSIFNDEPVKKFGKTSFNLSHEVKTSAKFGVLTPILMQECIPGDVFKFNTEQFIRFAPMLSPVMHQINAFVHYYFVPNRILLEHKRWEDFISPEGLPDQDRPEIPVFFYTGFSGSISASDRAEIHSQLTNIGTLLDYIGINIQHIPSHEEMDESGNLHFSLLPILAYHRIFRDYYIDQQFADLEFYDALLEKFGKAGHISTQQLALQHVSPEDKDEITWSDLLILFGCQLRCFEKDYFTSALPNTQTGADITIGTGQMPHLFVETGQEVKSSNPTRIDGSAITNNPNYVITNQGKILASNTSAGTQEITLNGLTSSRGKVVTEDGHEDITVNPTTINELRRAIRLQEFLERTMRAGKRLTEQIRAHFGVVSSDARLDRPEFIGGNMSPVTISEISGTAASASNVLGEYSGHASNFGNTKRRKYFCEEHGWLVALFSCMPRTSYCQGISKSFMRLDRFDYVWPEFANLGEQEVKNIELYVGKEDNDGVFGYQSRYADMKYNPSRVCGDFKRELDYWTMTRKFNNRPTLSEMFNQCNPAEDCNTRIFTVQSSEFDYLYCNFFHNITVRRTLPRYGVPML